MSDAELAAALDLVLAHANAVCDYTGDVDYQWLCDEKARLDFKATDVAIGQAFTALQPAAPALWSAPPANEDVYAAIGKACREAVARGTNR